MKTLFTKRRAVMALAILILTASGATSALAGPKKKGTGKKPAKPVVVETAVETAVESADLAGGLREDLARRRGQSSFANPVEAHRYAMMASRSAGLESKSTEESPASDAGERREMQESDVFKVGAPGSKLLYLLNNYRGLQVVSYVDGADKPRIVGRVKATGNWPENMYLDAKHSRLLVLERNFYDDSASREYNTEQSRVVLYDVSNPAAPKVAGVLPIEGEIADSRVVGDVLYLATSVRPDYAAIRGGEREVHKGKVFSVSLSGRELSIVDSAELALPTSRRENMGIVEVKAGDKYKYYLTAVLSESGWGWWDRQSWVELIDITDAKGKIKPVMTVAAKGAVERRQQVHIKDGTLLVASNYWVADDGSIAANRWSGKARVAMEAFRLPGADAATIDAAEAEYRRLHIARELKRSALQAEELDALRDKLTAAEELGLKGRFVADNGKLQKLVADSVVTTGDTTGQSASLRDVRYVGDKAYAVWVPANMVDPLDLFDISKAGEGAVKYMSRLQFEGWMEKLIPLRHEGREFLLGLGWLVENVNNERGRRYPQAMLFEVMQVGGKPRALDIAQVTLKDKNVWADLNGDDKMIDVKLGADGKGSIMFQVSSWDGKTSYSGGKLIGFDLAAAAEGRAEKVFAEGGLVKGDSGWLRRVFTNPEIAKVNTFSDRALGTFAVDHGKMVGAKETFEAMSTLELARDIRAYALLAGRGVQVVAEGNSYGGGGARTKLRLVKPDAADAEKPAILDEVDLKGEYRAHHVTSDGARILILTSDSSYEGNQYKVTEHVMEVWLDGNGRFSASAGTSWDSNRSHVRRMGGDASIGNGLAAAFSGFLPIKEAEGLGGYLVSSGRYGGSLKLLFLNGHDMKASDVVVEGDTLKGASKAEVIRLAEGFVVHFTMPLGQAEADPADRGSRVGYERHFLAGLNVELDGKAKLGPAVNIPGKPVAVIGGAHLLTEDTRLMDIEVTEHAKQGGPGKHRFESPVTERYFASLRFEGGKAVLVDYVAAEELQTEAMKPTSSGLVYVDNPKSGGYAGVRPMMGMRRPGRWRPTPTQPRLAWMTFDANRYFGREVKAIRGLELTGNVSLGFVTEQPGSPGTYLGVLSDGRYGQVITWDAKELAPSVVPVQVVDEKLNRSEPVGRFELPAGGYWGFYGEEGKIHFSAGDRSFEIAGGMAGVCQVYLTSPTALVK